MLKSYGPHISNLHCTYLPIIHNDVFIWQFPVAIRRHNYSSYIVGTYIIPTYTNEKWFYYDFNWKVQLSATIHSLSIMIGIAVTNQQMNNTANTGINRLLQMSVTEISDNCRL